MTCPDNLQQTVNLGPKNVDTWALHQLKHGFLWILASFATSPNAVTAAPQHVLQDTPIRQEKPAVLGGEPGTIHWLVVREKNAWGLNFACLFPNDIFSLLIHLFQETCRNLNYLSHYQGVSVLTKTGQQLKKLLKKLTEDGWAGASLRIS